MSRAAHLVQVRGGGGGVRELVADQHQRRLREGPEQGARSDRVHAEALSVT